MKTMGILSIAFLLSSLSTSAALAAAREPIIFKGTDIRPFVEFYRSQVRKLSKPITIYNWSPRPNDDFWDYERPQNDPKFAEMVKSKSDVFWKSYGDPRGANNQYGFGLYGAVDPVTTISFGTQNWLLLEMQLPIGFRMVKVNTHRDPGKTDLIYKLSTILTKFNCQSDDLNRLFDSGGARIPPLCRELVRRVFQQELKIDGFAYPYNQTAFKACDNSFYESSAAFVITSTRWIQPHLIKFYTEDTTSYLPDRIRIQTLFLKGRETGQDLFSAPLNQLKTYLLSHDASYVASSQTKCEDDKCVISVRFCNTSKFCENVDLPPIPRPGGPLITAAEAKRLQVMSRDKLLWDDLEGKPKSTTVDQWLKQNKYGCDGKDPSIPETQPAR